MLCPCLRFRKDQLGTLNFIFLADEDQANRYRNNDNDKASQQAVEEVH